MKITALVARILLGIIFLVFGLNGFLHFLPASVPPGPAGQYFVVMSQTHYLTIVFALQLICAVLLLINRWVPATLCVLAAVIVNILCFHFLMAPSGLPLAFLVTILWFLTAYPVRARLFALFE